MTFNREQLEMIAVLHEKEIVLAKIIVWMEAKGYWAECADAIGIRRTEKKPAASGNQD